MSIQVVRETHEAPESLQERLKHIGGTNLFGEPNYRVVWGWSRLTWIGGKWTDNDINGNLLREVVELRQEPKYLPLNRWHVERWLPPETYGSPRAWYAQTIERADGISLPALGPFPRRGEYEHCFTLQGPSGEFVALTPTACETIARVMELSRMALNGQRELALRRREEGIARDAETRADAILDDATPALHGQPFVTTAS